jgi:preprotein translocase SecF subunit
LAMEIRLKEAGHDELRRLVRVLRTGASVEAFLRDVFQELLVEDGLQIGELKEGRARIKLVTLEPIEPAKIEAVLARAKCTSVRRLTPAVGNEPTTEFAYEVTPPGAAAPGLNALREDLRKNFVVADPFMRLRKISGQVASQMQLRALFAIILALGMIVGYIWFRFQLRFGLAAIAALAHDVLITLGVLAIFGKEINLRIIAALLTIIGYSLNDTIVVFDRIRENMGILRGRLFGEIINVSINQTLARTLLTSMSTLLAVGALFVWGGEVIRDFAFALIVGVIVGTYSSVFIASPILLVGRKKGSAPTRL